MQGVHPARLAFARLPWQLQHQWRVLVGQRIQRGIDLLDAAEAVQASGAGAQLGGSLRAAQHQQRQCGQPCAVDVPRVVEAVFVLGDTAAGR
ncbi:hypothetical protein D3C85_1308170 [compost metagenome]